MTATIRSSNFSRSELAIVRSALADVPTRVRSILRRLRTAERVLQQRAASRAPAALLPQVGGPDRRRLRTSFGFHVHAAGASSNLTVVIQRYTAALNILTDRNTIIDRLTPQLIARINATLARNRATYRLRGAYVWGRAAVDFYNAGLSSADLIFIGDAFFNQQRDDTVLSSVTACGGRTEVPIARAAVLTHEAVHWHNGTGGHASMGALRNPENYQRFMIRTFCNRFAQATISSDQHLATYSGDTSPGVPPMLDRLRKPGPIV